MLANGAIVYEGPSLLKGHAPIFVALTGLITPSHNEKTGPMVQAWILNADRSPTEAVRTGHDDAICGDCRHRSGSNIGRSCYVVWWLGPQRVYDAYTRGIYPRVRPMALASILKDKHVRFGADGDPAAAPSSVWFDLSLVAGGYTGYTHQWRSCDQNLQRILMASVDSQLEKSDAHRRGWRTFRVRRLQDDVLLPDEVVCPASAEANHAATCDDCRLCGGLARVAKSVAIYPHGQRIRWLKPT